MAVACKNSIREKKEKGNGNRRREVRETSRKKRKKKQTASGGKQSVSQKELTYLRKYADSSVTVAFGDRKLLGQWE